MLLEQHATTAASQGAILRQTSEVTCGPTALASLLNFYYGENTSEAKLAELSNTYSKGTTTLLGLRDSCLAIGYHATGYKMTLPQLINETDSSGVPVLVHFKEPTMHYALVAGQVGDFILVSDPSLGNISMSVDDFQRRWSNKVLVVKSETRPANKEIVVNRKQSAAIRLNTLARAGNLMSSF